MERYDAYKDSGVEWIGEIPKRWTCANLGSISSQRKSLNRDGSVDNVLSLSYGTIKRRLLDNTGLMPESFNTYNVIEEGDVVLRLTDLQNDQKSLRVGLCHEKGVITAAYTTLEPQSIDSRYLFYNLATFDYWKGFYGLAGGVRQSLTFDGIRGLRFPLPSVLEQQAIADFLDSKTAEIDSLVADCEREVELLQEYRKAVISEAVTKGLDPDAPMKDSGVEWIGRIPEKWALPKLGSLAVKIGSGKTPRGGADVYVENGVPFLRSQNVYDTGLILDNLAFISDDIDGEMSSTRVVRSDVLLNITGGSIGRCCVYEMEYHANVNQHVCIIRLNHRALPKYIQFFWNSNLGATAIRLFQTGANREGMNFEQIASARIPLPSLEGQQEIVRYLDTKTAEIDSLIEAKQAMADKLREYRRSLISEAVTGKFKVPGID